MAGDFARFGLSVKVLPHGSSWSDSPCEEDIVVIDTDSRASTREESSRRHQAAAAFLCHFRPDVILLKVDSLMRGHVASNIQQVIEAMHVTKAIVANAVPDQDRYTQEGVLFSGGAPVMGPDGKPIDIVDLIAQGADVGARVLGKFDGALDGKDTGVQVADVRTVADLHTAVARGIANDVRLIVGSYGIAAPIVRVLTAARNRLPVLAICGSVNSMARRQIAAVALQDQVHTIHFDAVTAVTTGEVVLRCATAVQETIAAGKDVLIHSAGVGLVEADEADEQPVESASLAIERLCALVLGACSEQLGAVVATGGATAAALLRASGAKAVHPLGHEAAPCAPLLRISGGCMNGKVLITKPGSFGDETTLAIVLQAAATASLIRSSSMESRESVAG